MPFYEYECSACKFYVEALQKISEPPLRECPSCKQETLSRLISAPVFRLKGAGWYETDFKSDKEGKRNLAGREDAAASETTTESKGRPSAKPAETKAADAKPSETQPAAKADSSASKPETKSASKPAAESAKPAATSPAASAKTAGG